MEVWRLVGCGGEVGAAASARQHIHHNERGPPALPTHRGAGGAVCGHSGEVTADARGEGPGWLSGK